MPAKTGVRLKDSKPEEVDAYMSRLKHPLADVAEALRRVILNADRQIGEEIKWNAPAFFYTGAMKQFNPKDHRRHVVVFNFHRKDRIRLVFPSGARIGDTSGLLEGDYADGRRLAFFASEDEVNAKEAALQEAIQKWLSLLERD